MFIDENGVRTLSTPESRQASMRKKVLEETARLHAANQAAEKALEGLPADTAKIVRRVAYAAQEDIYLVKFNQLLAILEEIGYHVIDSIEFCDGLRRTLLAWFTVYNQPWMLEPEAAVEDALDCIEACRETVRFRTDFAEFLSHRPLPINLTLASDNCGDELSNSFRPLTVDEIYFLPTAWI